MNADLTLPGPSSFEHDENINQSNLNYKSNHRLEIEVYHASSSEIDDNMQNDSDEKDSSYPPFSGWPSSQETIFGPGRALGNAAGYTELNKAMTDDP